jgi:hypothetical protein
MGRQGIRDVHGFPGWDDKNLRVLFRKDACLLGIKLPGNIPWRPFSDLRI